MLNFFQDLKDKPLLSYQQAKNKLVIEFAFPPGLFSGFETPGNENICEKHDNEHQVTWGTAYDVKWT